ncbi:Uncharacterised protein [Serratia marcescens]|nr:Uncharacterised protein [Serratia marcescens]
MRIFTHQNSVRLNSHNGRSLISMRGYLHVGKEMKGIPRTLWLK